MTLRINTLTPGEQRKLKKISVYDRRSRWRVRAKIVLLSATGYSCPVIATRLGCHVTTARRWVKRWNQTGLEALTQADRWANHQRHQKRCQAFHLLLQYSPVHLNLPFTTWSCRTLAAFLRDFVDSRWSYQQVWFYLKHAGFRYRKVDARFRIKPPTYDLWKATKRLLDRFLPADTLLLYVDEKGPLTVTRYGGHCWGPKRFSMEVRQPIHGKFHLFGAYDPRADQIWLIPMDHKDSGEFCDALAKLWVQLDHRLWKRLLVIMDNASYHRSKYTTQYLAGMPHCNVLFLPPYSPELNPIEQRFRQYTKEVLEMGTFTSKNDLLTATSAWEYYYNSFRREIFPPGGDS